MMGTAEKYMSCCFQFFFMWMQSRKTHFYHFAILMLCKHQTKKQKRRKIIVVRCLQFPLRCLHSLTFQEHIFSGTSRSLFNVFLPFALEKLFALRSSQFLQAILFERLINFSQYFSIILNGEKLCKHFSIEICNRKRETNTSRTWRKESLKLNRFKTRESRTKIYPK